MIQRHPMISFSLNSGVTASQIQGLPGPVNNCGDTVPTICARIASSQGSYRNIVQPISDSSSQNIWRSLIAKSDPTLVLYPEFVRTVSAQLDGIASRLQPLQYDQPPLRLQIPARTPQLGSPSRVHRYQTQGGER